MNVIKISKCNECPFMGHGGVTGPYCRRQRQESITLDVRVTGNDQPPDWCPIRKGLRYEVVNEQT